MTYRRRTTTTVSSQQVATWAIRQNDYVTTELIEKEFDVTNERARRILRYLRDADRFKVQIKKIETSSGKTCYAVKIEEVERAYASCNKRQTELIRKGNVKTRSSFRRATRS